MQTQPHVHLAGVAGSGMNPLAQALLAQGYRVTGSDRYFDQGTPIPAIKKLQAAGVEFYPQDGSAITADSYALVTSTAIESDNPELLAAQELNVFVKHRSEMLAEIVREKSCIAIAGTSGKTTTTGMVGYALDALGQNPTVINGGVIVNWVSDSNIGNVKNGVGPLWIIEADESDKSLLNYTPEWAIITTISMDHFGLEETIDLFRAFAARVQKGIICGPGVKPYLEGATQAALLEIENPPIPIPLNMPGAHNQLNAACTALLCQQLGCTSEAIRTTLERFAGIERRMQRMSTTTSNHPVVYDDFGHNPEKIRAAMHAASDDSDRLLVCWKPHGFGPLKTMSTELMAMWSSFTARPFKLYILPVYYVGGTTSRAMESDGFVSLLQAAGIDASYATDYESLSQTLLDVARTGDTILSMGARDPELPHFARNLAAQFEPV